MGLLAASSTVVRFVAPVPSRLDRAALAEAITRRLFRDGDAEAMGGGPVCGWVGIHDPLATALDTADLFFQQYLAVGFRFDRRTVPAKLLWLERRRLEDQRKVERGVPRLGAAERREIKAEVEARLLLRALPAPRLFDCVWNLDTGRLYFTGKARLAREAFIDLWRQTFGVAPVPLIPYLAAEHVGVPPRVVDAFRAVEPASLIAVEPPPRPAEDDVPRLQLPMEEARG